MDDRERYLRLVFPDEVLAVGGEIEIRLIPAGRPQGAKPQKLRFGRIAEVIELKQPKGFHVFVAPVTREGRMERVGGDIGTLRFTRCVWADVDRKPREGEPGTLTEAIQRSNDLGLTPSFALQSGPDPERGHLYWLLDRPLEVRTYPERLRRVLLAMRALVGGDPMVAGPEKLMRVPGTQNVKPEYGPCYPWCRFIEPSWEDPPYAIERIEAFLNLDRKKAVSVHAAPKTGTKASPTKEPGGVGNPQPLFSAGAPSLGARLETCAFIRHARAQAGVLPEPLWEAMLLVLRGLGDDGRTLAHTWSRPHPDYNEAQTDQRLAFARGKDYRPPGCDKIRELGFDCPNFDPTARRCTVLGVRSPADLVVAKHPPTGGGFTDAEGTWEHTDRGPRRIAGFSIEFLREVQAGDARSVEGLVRQADRPDRDVRWHAEVFTDARSLQRQLAKDLGLDFVADRRSLLTALDIWRDLSHPERLVYKSDFGFNVDGATFIDSISSIPSSSPRFRAQEASLAARLGLAQGEGGERVAAEIIGLWCRVVDDPPFVGTMFGIVGWSLIAPVMEYFHPEIRGLLAWLAGRTGVGKTTHALIAQAFFGVFPPGSLANFGSTSLSLEQAGHWFRGALMVIDDVKRSCMNADAQRNFNGLIQRIWDRSARTRLNNDGTAQPSLPFRATALFTGEDLVLGSEAGAARLLLVQVPDPRGTPKDLAALSNLLPQFPKATRLFVAYLCDDPAWKGRAWETWTAVQSRALADLPPDRNRPRLAASVASVATGYRLAREWLESLKIAPPCEERDILDRLLRSATDQRNVMAALAPGRWFLDGMRTILAGQYASVGGKESRGAPIICWSADRKVAYVLPEPALALIRQHLLPREAQMPDRDAIASDLDHMDALVEKDEGRRTKRKRMNDTVATTWAIRGDLLTGGGEGDRDA